MERKKNEEVEWDGNAVAHEDMISDRKTGVKIGATVNGLDFGGDIVLDGVSPEVADAFVKLSEERDEALNSAAELGKERDSFVRQLEEIRKYYTNSERVAFQSDGGDEGLRDVELANLRKENFDLVQEKISLELLSSDLKAVTDDQNRHIQQLMETIEEIQSENQILKSRFIYQERECDAFTDVMQRIIDEVDQSEKDPIIRRKRKVFMPEEVSKRMGSASKNPPNLSDTDTHEKQQPSSRRSYHTYENTPVPDGGERDLTLALINWEDSAVQSIIGLVHRGRVTLKHAQEMIKAVTGVEASHAAILYNAKTYQAVEEVLVAKQNATNVEPLRVRGHIKQYNEPMLTRSQAKKQRSMEEDNSKEIPKYANKPESKDSYRKPHSRWQSHCGLSLHTTETNLRREPTSYLGLNRDKIPPHASLVVFVSKNKVRLYRFSAEHANVRYYRCPKCDLLNKSKRDKWRPTIVVRNETIVGNTAPTHHRECKPISLEELEKTHGIRAESLPSSSPDEKKEKTPTPRTMETRSTSRKLADSVSNRSYTEPDRSTNVPTIKVEDEYTDEAKNIAEVVEEGIMETAGCSEEPGKEDSNDDSCSRETLSAKQKSRSNEAHREQGGELSQQLCSEYASAGSLFSREDEKSIINDTKMIEKTACSRCGCLLC
ncbi:hypothetical protein AB6A40_008042 [Gnathostoma spinigerum]|uniref:RYYR-CCHC domain-containing protein n=1 Tax=Gnathostoma spinigerum TaxID=75299 RepID=A0ABD6EN90_9BILA